MNLAEKRTMEEAQLKSKTTTACINGLLVKMCNIDQNISYYKMSKIFEDSELKFKNHYVYNLDNLS